VIEDLFMADYHYLQALYHKINGVEGDGDSGGAPAQR
jgi:hypothetical protein